MITLDGEEVDLSFARASYPYNKKENEKKGRRINTKTDSWEIYQVDGKPYQNNMW